MGLPFPLGFCLIGSPSGGACSHFIQGEAFNVYPVVGQKKVRLILPAFPGKGPSPQYGAQVSALAGSDAPQAAPPRRSKLDRYTEHIDRRMAEGLENCVVLLRELRTRGPWRSGASRPTFPFIPGKNRTWWPEGTLNTGETIWSAPWERC